MASFPITERNAAEASSNVIPSTLFKLIKITGNCPIYFSHNSFFFCNCQTFKQICIAANFKKTFQHVHVQRLAKTSWPCKQIHFLPILQKFFYFNYQVIASYWYIDFFLTNLPLLLFLYASTMLHIYLQNGHQFCFRV